MKSGEIKSRSPFHAVTDWIYCPEPLGSPWPVAVGCQGVLGSKSSQLLHGRDFLFYYTLAAFIDLKKTFDTVNHNILLEKLNHAGIKTNLLILIKSYLTNRSQRTLCNGVISGIQYITCGVCTMFYLSIRKKVNLWYLEPETKLIEFKILKLQYYNKQNLQVVPTYKHLGFNLDQTLHYKYHVGTILNNISFKLYLFSKVRRFLNEKSAITVYKSMILPCYEYCDVI